MRLCKAEDCDRPRWGAKNYCRMHYTRIKNHGTLAPTRASKNELMSWIVTVALNNKDKKRCLIWPYNRDKDGYGGLVTYEGKRQQAHRVICTLVHGKPTTTDNNARHSCGKGHEGCVNLWHLSWGTSKQNHADRILHGTNPVGERHAQSKLTERDVRRILLRIDKGRSNRCIAESFNVTPEAIHAIRMGKTWKHIER